MKGIITALLTLEAGEAVLLVKVLPFHIRSQLRIRKESSYNEPVGSLSDEEE